MRAIVRHDPAFIRDVLDHDQAHGPVATIQTLGVSCQALYRWRALAAELPGWPNAQDVADWHRQNQARAEHRAIDDRYRRRRYQAGGQPLTVDPTGTMRRLQALYAQGWTWNAIAAEAGRGTSSRIQRLAWGRNCMDRGVYLDTAREIAALYDRLRRVSPLGWTAARARANAVRRGWATADAWLDIDDPNETPDPGWQPIGPGRSPHRRSKAELVEEFDWLVENGETRVRAAERLGVSLATIRDTRTLLARETEEGSDTAA